MSIVRRIRERGAALRREAIALYLAAKDPRTPRLARIVVVATVAYALSPIDLIPDFIPVLGLLDDLLIIPLGVAIAVRLIPPAVLAECRARAAALAEKPVSRGAAIAVATAWLLAIALAALLAWRLA